MGNETKTNTPGAAPQNQAEHPVDRVIQKIGKEKMSGESVRSELDTLAKEIREKNLIATEEQLQKLREVTKAETSADAAEKGVENEVLAQSLNELDQRLVLVETAAKAPAAEPSLFSKEGMKKAFSDGMKSLGETLTALAAVLDQLREQIAVSIGGNLDMLKSFIGEKRVNMLKGFIGEDRIQLSKTLNAANITLPMAAFLQARKKIEEVRAKTGSASRGWNAEKMSFVLVEKLKGAGVTGKEEAGVLEQKINDAATILQTEILASPVTSGSPVDFVDTGKPPENRMFQMIGDKQVLVQSNGSVTVAGQKWKVRRGGLDMAVSRAELNNGAWLLEDASNRNIIFISEKLQDTVNELASTDAAKNKVEVKKDGAVLLEFIRNPS